MGLFFLLLAPLCFAQSSSPSYSIATITNTATSLPVVSPGSLVTITGSNLAVSSREFNPLDVGSYGQLPISFAGTGTTVLVHGLPAPLFSVSPEKVVFLIPYDLSPSQDIYLWVTVNGSAGPRVVIHLYNESPGLFLLEPGAVRANHRESEPVTMENPATPGERLTLFATGLGPTNPFLEYRVPAPDPAPLIRLPELKLLLNGQPLDSALISYAGALAGTSGISRIEFTLPADTPPNPEIRLAMGDSLSPEGVQLFVK